MAAVLGLPEPMCRRSRTSTISTTPRERDEIAHGSISGP
jgi:hypothetical protein